ncbi:MAG TPA: HD domain-containing protein [Chloroflexota bacterium]|nr:HD domain-containing protein [Chloroflexota bacterium]HUM67885.1 HD domain-containing protein [Chloroflexota bacterium]
MLLEKYCTAIAKTAHGGQSLYAHTFQCVDSGLRIARFVPDYSPVALSSLIMSLSIHDIGKLDPTFQLMLQTKLKGQTYNGKLVKHEGQSLAHDHVPLVESSLNELAAELKANFNYQVNIDQFLQDDGWEWAWAAAVNHHGLFYLSHEQDEAGNMQRQARRQWTSYTPLEVRRLTLVDFLFHFHPLGGLVIMADQIASYAFDKGIALDSIFAHAKTLSAVFNKLFDVAEETEASMNRDEPRNYQLRDMLQLLAGNLV